MTDAASCGMTGLDAVIELNNLRPVFSALGLAGEVLEELRRDAGFGAIVARTLLGPERLRRRRGPAVGAVFPPLRRFEVPALAGKRIGLVASGGAGAMASLVGVKRALEEAGLEVAALSACSGAVLFASLWACGLDADEMARFWLEIEDRDYIDPDWGALVRGASRGFRGWAGLLAGAAIERTFARRVGDLRLGETRVPLSAVVWNIDRNRVEYVGTRQTPGLALARAARVAISIPILVEPVELDGQRYGDGGVVDIFPVRPLLDERLDEVLGVNCYHAEDFGGEDATGWYDRTAAVLRATGQLRWSGHLALARAEMRLLGDRLTMLHPVAYDEVRGARFYRSFLDRADWPRYMRLGHEHARAALRAWGSRRPHTAPPRSEPLTRVDAAWLRMDRPDNPMTVTAALLFDRPVEHARLLEVQERAIAAQPRFRERIRSEADARPLWETVAAVDLDAHVERLASPGDAAALRALIGRLASAPLPRDRPLWQLHHVEGQGGGSVVVVRLHHALGDGTALVRLLLSLAEPIDAGADAAPHPHAPHARPRPLAAAAALARLAALPPDPRTPLRAPLGGDKRVGWSGPLSLARLASVAHAAHATTNDVYLAALAGALGRDGLHAPAVHALVPVDLRGDDAGPRLGNRFGLVYAPLPLDTADAAARLDAISAAMAARKRSPDARVALAALGIIGGLPPVLHDALVKLFAAKASLVATSVVGPAARLRLAGAEVAGLLVWVPESARLGLGVSLLSYAGSARIGVISDANVLADPQHLVDGIVAELAALGG
jgi:NTE family protein